MTIGGITSLSSPTARRIQRDFRFYGSLFL
jgi:hypothetical protein